MSSSIIDELNSINKDYNNVLSILKRSLSLSNECNINGLEVIHLNNYIYVAKKEGDKIISTIYFVLDDSNPYRIIYIQVRDKNGNLSLRKRLSLVLNNNDSSIIPRNPNIEEIEIIEDLFNTILSRKKVKTRRKVLPSLQLYTFNYH